MCLYLRHRSGTTRGQLEDGRQGAEGRLTLLCPTSTSAFQVVPGGAGAVELVVAGTEAGADEEEEL